MKTYDKYKSSGIDWIGDIPTHWEVKKLKFVGDSLIGIIYSPDDVTTNENDLLVLRSSNVQNGVLAFEDNVYVNKSVKEKYLTKTGDILICARNGSAHLVGKSAYIDEKSSGFTFGAFMSVFRSKSGRLLYYFFNSAIFKAQTGLFSTSTINQLTADTLNNMFMAFPSQIEEEIAITNYLDEKTAQIDKLIDEKRRLIELLKEERLGVINQAVTRGINPHAKLKPSGIAWLGDIPEHWEVKKLKYLVSKVGSGITPSGGANVYLEEGIPLLRSQNIYNEGLILDDVAFISEEIDEQMSNSRVKDNDVLLNITGASIGRCCYIPKNFGRGNVNQHVCIIRPIPSAIETKYLHAFLVSGIGQNLVDSCQTGANREGLNFQQIKSFEIPISDVAEQKQIVEFIETAAGKIDATIATIEKEIGFMREYRTALISEVVTGKIKVM